MAVTPAAPPLDPRLVNTACADGQHDRCPGKVLDLARHDESPTRHHVRCACCAAGHPGHQPGGGSE